MVDTPALASPLPVAGQFDFRGTVYRFAPFDTVEVVAKFEGWILEQAWHHLRRSKDFLDRTEYQEQVEGMRRDITAGLYTWGGPIRERVLHTAAGQKQLVLYMLQAEQPNVTMPLVETIWKDLAAAERIVGLMLETADPNAKPPATAGGTNGNAA